MRAPPDPPSAPGSRFVVAIPACNEADRIEACLRAVAEQRGTQDSARCDHILLLLNNCTDDTALVVERLRPDLAVPVTVATREFPAGMANAGHARSEAMAMAVRIAGADGIVATTDADGVVARDWIACTRAAFALGVDVVCGRALIDPVEAMQITAALHADDEREVAYGAMLDEIHGLVDPDPFDPLPRHAEHSGASIATTARAYLRAGGMPTLPTGEDRGFLLALRAVDARIRHAPDVHVTVSGRLQGRAAGGMADTMARRMVRQDAMLDDQLEPALTCLRRAGLRATARAAWSGRLEPTSSWCELVRILSREAALPVEAISAWLQTAYFGQAWMRIEASSPALVRVPVVRATLDRHVAAAGRILASLRNEMPAAAAGPADSHPDAELRSQ